VKLLRVTHWEIIADNLSKAGRLVLGLRVSGGLRRKNNLDR
jgi:hypothetical protein